MDLEISINVSCYGLKATLKLFSKSLRRQYVTMEMKIDRVFIDSRGIGMLSPSSNPGRDP